MKHLSKRKVFNSVAQLLKLTCVMAAVLVIFNLVGCTTETPVIPTAPSASEQAPAGNMSLAIYLLVTNPQPEALASQCHLEREGEPVITIDDVVSYEKATHTIILTNAGYERLQRLQVPTSGLSFALYVDNEPIYSGAFWTNISSQSFDGVVIIVEPSQPVNDPVIKIQLGYPGSDFYKGDDPRSDSRIMQVLQQAGKLR
jgi:hypothetical protein